jgi:ankyrin repeat protein
MKQVKSLVRTSSKIRPERIFEKLKDEIYSVLDCGTDEQKQEWKELYPTHEFKRGTPIWTESREYRIKELIQQLTSYHLKKFLPIRFEPSLDIDDENMPILINIANLFLSKIGWNTFLFSDLTPDDGWYSGTNIFELFILNGQNCERLLRTNNGEIDINIKNDVDWTPLFYAVNSNNLNCTRFLIEAGADPNAKDDTDSAPLHLAKDVEIVKVLLKAGANPNAEGPGGYTRLHMTKDNLEIVKVLLKAGANPNADGGDGYTPLHDNHNLEIVKVLLKAGANPNAKLKYNQWTPLFFVEDVEIVKVLIEAGADPNAKDTDGRSILTDSIRRKLLLKAGYIYGYLSGLIKRELKELKYFWKDYPQEKVRFQQQILSKNLVCPITGQIMTNPVINSVNSIYEKTAIEKWHQKNRTRQSIKDPSKGLDYTDRKITTCDIITEIEDFLRNKLRQLTRKQQSQHQQKQRSNMFGQDIRQRVLPNIENNGVQQTKGGY